MSELQTDAGLHAFRISSPLPPEEAADQLRQHLRPPYRLGFLPASSGIYGKVCRERVVLFRYAAQFRNSFRPVFYGAFVPDGSGSALVGKFRYARFTRVFLRIFIGFNAFMVAIALLEVLQRGWNSVFLPIIMPVLMVLGVIAMAKIGWHMARGEMEEIGAFMREVLDERAQDDR